MNSGDGSIHRANLDGSGIETLVASGQTWVKDVELDLPNGKMYWTYNGGVRRANLDGSNIEQVLTDGSDSWDIALDVSSRSAYYPSLAGNNAAVRKILNVYTLSWSTLVPGANTYITGIMVYNAPVIPEPSALALVALGILGLLARRRM